MGGRRRHQACVHGWEAASTSDCLRKPGCPSRDTQVSVGNRWWTPPPTHAHTPGVAASHPCTHAAHYLRLAMRLYLSTARPSAACLTPVLSTRRVLRRLPALLCVDHCHAASLATALADPLRCCVPGWAIGLPIAPKASRSLGQRACGAHWILLPTLPSTLLTLCS